MGKKLVCRTGVITADVDFNGFRASFTISLASYGSRQILLYSGLLGSRQSIKNMSTVFFNQSTHAYCQHNDNESPPGSFFAVFNFVEASQLIRIVKICAHQTFLAM